MQHTSPAGGPAHETPQPSTAPDQPSPMPDQPHSHQPAGGAPVGGHQEASSGLDPKVASLLAYITWIGGVVILLTQKQPSVRFHGVQSILFNVVVVAAYIALTVTDVFARLFIGGWTVGTIFFLLGAALWVGSLVLWIVLVIKAYNLQQFKLPVIGNLAAKWTKA